jgi:glycosyltransferase involved in cell wall biosynthesis
VITLSAFKPQKNLLDFLRVAKEVKQKFGTISFLLVGDGDEREKLEAWIQGNHLENTVKLLGWRKDTASLLAASDIFVLTSLWEGLPRAMVEALILGKPCVCYQTDGVKDLLRKGGGYLVDQHDVSKFSERILELLKHPDVYASFSSQAKALITKEFDIDEMVVAQERLYEALLALNHS